MAKRYIKIGWENKPSVKTPVNMANLGRMDKGIDDCDNAIEEIYSKRVNNVVTTNEDTFLAGPVGKVLQDQVTELNKNFQGTLPASSKGYHLSPAGWYRVAVFETNDIALIKGSDCNSVNISIKRSYNTTSNEYYNILLMSIFNKSQFVLIGKLVNVQNITKIRHTVDAANLKAYIEIYYTSQSSNDLQISLYDTKSVTGAKWDTIIAVATEETVDGVSVVSSMDLTTA